MSGTNYYFGGKLIKNAGGWVYADRLGSIGKFYPYGVERPSATTNGTEKFTGYFRDAETGNDYAINRYQSPGLGRFITPDPSQGTYANPANPGSWNLYAYVKGDPINNVDRLGLDDDDNPELCDGSDPDSTECDSNNTGVTGVDPFNGVCTGVCGGDDPAPIPVEGTTVNVTDTTDPTELSPDPSPVFLGPTYRVTITLNPSANPGGPPTTSPSFSQCMASNANNFSIAGAADYVFHTNIRNSTLGFGAVLGNSVTTLAFGSFQENATGIALMTPTFVSRGMGTVTSYGRRTAAIAALNLAGKGGLPLALGMGSTVLKGAIGLAGDVAGAFIEAETKLGIDLAITAGEAVYCASQK